MATCVDPSEYHEDMFHFEHPVVSDEDNFELEAVAHGASGASTAEQACVDDESKRRLKRALKRHGAEEITWNIVHLAEMIALGLDDRYFLTRLREAVRVYNMVVADLHGVVPFVDIRFEDVKLGLTDLDFGHRLSIHSLEHMVNAADGSDGGRANIFAGRTAVVSSAHF